MKPHSTAPSNPPSDLDQLRWVQRLAYRMCSDSALADDMGQEVFTAGLTAGLAGVPAEPEQRRAWYAGAIRNKIAMVRRGQFRRRTHEEGAARERQQAEHSDSSAPDVLLERFETHRRVADAVASLREPYRSTLLMRYFEGKSPKQIARTTGAPIGTVKTQITRGLKELKRELEAEFEGDGGWRAALLPLALIDGRMLPALGKTTAGKPSLWSLSSTGTLIVSACLGVASLIAIRWTASPPELDREDAQHITGRSADGATRPNRPEVGRTGASEEGSTSRRRPAAKARAQDRPETDRPSAAPAVTLEVRVVDLDGRPISGVTVERTTDSVDSPPEAIGMTDGSGALTASISLGAALLRVRAPGLVTAIPGSVLAVGSQQSTSIVAANARRVIGLVVDVEGRPIEGARITYRSDQDLRLQQQLLVGRASRNSWSRVTNADGLFSFDIVPELPSSVLEVNHPELRDIVHSVDSAGFVDAHIVLERDRTTVRGRIIDATGSALPRAYVALGNTSTRSGQNGEFSFDGVTTPSIEIRVVSPKAGWATWTGRLDEALKETPIIRVVRAPGALLGAVRSAMGSPRPGIRVALLDRLDFGITGQETEPRRWTFQSVESLLGNGSTQVTTDAEGRFELTGIGGRSYRLLIVDPATMAVQIGGPFSAGEPPIDIRMDEAVGSLVLSGQVTDRDGTPLQGVSARVFAEAESDGEQTVRTTRVSGPSAVTDENGRFKIGGLAETGALRLQVFGGLDFEAASVAAKPGHAVDVSLHRVRTFYLSTDAEHVPKLDRFELLTKDTSKPLPLTQTEGSDAFEILAGEIENSRSPVYRARIGPATLVGYSGGVEVIRVSIELPDGDGVCVVRY